MGAMAMAMAMMMMMMMMVQQQLSSYGASATSTAMGAPSSSSSSDGDGDGDAAAAAAASKLPSPSPRTGASASSASSSASSSAASASASSDSASADHRRPIFPAFFIFGDSLVDAGNNNFIVSVAKADRLPFGIDFPAGPTGRFSNGKTVLDQVAEIIELPYPPPYLNPSTKGDAILRGVNFASGAGGYLESSGFNFIGRVDFDRQIEWFGNTVQQLRSQMGPDAAQKLLSEALFITVFGSNDYVNNYLLSYSPLNKVFTPPEFRDVILQKISAQITEVYKLGARKMVVAGVGPIGCIPSQLVRQRSVNGECSEYVNSMAMDFNHGLEATIAQLNERLPGARVLYADTFAPVMDIVNNPKNYGFEFVSEACCGAGKYKGQLLCIPVLKPCENRRVHVFWDAFHPTEATNVFLGRSLFSIVTPIIPNATASSSG